MATDWIVDKYKDKCSHEEDSFVRFCCNSFSGETSIPPSKVPGTKRSRVVPRFILGNQRGYRAYIGERFLTRV